MKLAIKKPEGATWKTELSFEDIQKMLQAGEITNEWHVCPQGNAKDAVLISEFLANPSVFWEQRKPSFFNSISYEKKDESKSKTKKKDWDVLVPCLAYFPIVFLVGHIFLIGDPFAGFYIFVFSGAPLLVLVPVYAVAICILYVKRKRNFTNTISITLFQLLPLIIYVCWLLFWVNFNGSPA